MKKTFLMLLVTTMLLALLVGCEEQVDVVDYFTPGDYMVVNIAQSYRLLKISPVMVLNVDSTKKLEGSEMALADELTAMQPQIRDVINRIIRTKVLEELTDEGALDAIRAEIVAAMQQEMGMTYVTEVYFSDFVVQ